MATQAVTPAPAAQAPSERAQILQTVLAFGFSALMVFVKNPATQQKAASIVTALSPLLTELEGLL
jgi:hypothetical protein